MIQMFMNTFIELKKMIVSGAISIYGFWLFCLTLSKGTNN